VSGTNSGDQTITLSGDATGSGTSGVAVTLANSGVTAGTYTKITVDAKGRATVGASLASGDLPTHTHTAANISDSTTVGRALLTAASVAAQRTALGLGTGDSPTFTGLTATGGLTVSGVSSINNQLNVGVNGNFTFYDNANEAVFQVNNGDAFNLYTTGTGAGTKFYIDNGANGGMLTLGQGALANSGVSHIQLNSTTSTRPVANFQAAASTAVNTGVILISNGAGNVVAQLNASGALQQMGVTFASLPSGAANGNLIFCSDCTMANPCAGSGNGAFAKRLNNIWVCN